MPDLMTHLVTTHILRRSWEYARRSDFTGRQAASLYVGGCLPDFVSRLPSIATGLLSRWGVITPAAAAKCYNIWYCFHTPLPAAMVAYLLVMLLPESGRAFNFLLIIVACALHFGLDALQSTLGDPGTLWLYPFSWKTAYLHLFWPDRAILALPWLGGVVVILEILRKSGRFSRRS